MMQEQKALGRSEWRQIILFKSIVPHSVLLYSSWCCKSRNSHFALLPHLLLYTIVTIDCALCSFSSLFLYLLKSRLFFFLTWVVAVVTFCHWHAHACASLLVNLQPYATSCTWTSTWFSTRAPADLKLTLVYVSSKTPAFLMHELIVCRYV